MAVPITPTPLDPEIASSFFNSTCSGFQGSGGPSGLSGTVSGLGDWTIKTQSIQGFWKRYQSSKDCVAPVGTTPSVEFNYVQMRCYVATKTVILRNAYFSSVLQETQNISLAASGCSAVTGIAALSGGFQEAGRFWTTREAVVRRPSLKDINGNITDASGTCTNWFNVDVNHSPGEWACDTGWDTYNSRQNDMNLVLLEANNYCPDFDSNLVCY